MCYIGKKTDVPGTEGYVPTLFAWSCKSTPRPSTTSTAAGYAPLPKTWCHARHQLSRSRIAHARLSATPVRGRPPTNPTSIQSGAPVPEILKTCGHDYLQTAVDTAAYADEHVAAMTEVDRLRDENQLLFSRMLCLRNVKGNDRLMQFYTNLPNFEVFDSVCEYLRSRVASGNCNFTRVHFDTVNQHSEQVSDRRGSVCRMSFEDEFFLVLVKLKTGRLNEDLAYQFGISVGLVSNMFTKWLFFLESELRCLFEMADGDVDGVPSVYQNLSALRIIIDCTELMLQKASDLQECKQTFSQYKHHDTVKFLVGMSPQLYINYISQAWAGRASDKHITLQSTGLLAGLKHGSVVMADRGFTVSQDLHRLGVRTIIPAFKKRGKPQLSFHDCSSSEDVAKARIHIERIIQRIRTFHILGSVVRLNMTDIIEQIFRVCAYLTNFQTPIIRPNEVKFRS